MIKLNRKILSRLLAVVLLSVSGLSVAAIANSSLALATADEYVWVIMETPIDPASYKYNCRYDYDYQTFQAFRNCLYNTREDADNGRSQQWGISDKVVREKDTVYIEVPNRDRPLAFQDRITPYEEEQGYKFLLESFDSERQLLYVHQEMSEVSRTMLVNLKSGFWQEFSAENLSISPNMLYMVGFSSSPGSEGIVIWKREAVGYYRNYYQQIYNSDEYTDTYNEYKKYYQADKADEMYDTRKITWVNDNEFHTDYFYKFNEADAAAFRIRYTFMRNNKNDKWQMIIAKLEAK